MCVGISCINRDNGQVQLAIAGVDKVNKQPLKLAAHERKAGRVDLASFPFRCGPVHLEVNDSRTHVIAAPRLRCEARKTRQVIAGKRDIHPGAAMLAIVA